MRVVYEKPFVDAKFPRRISWEWFWKTLISFALFSILGVFGNLMLWRSHKTGNVVGDLWLEISDVFLSFLFV